MTITWFPGHMNKARRQIEDILPQIHLVIEVLDARIPFSSQNPMIANVFKLLIHSSVDVGSLKVLPPTRKGFAYL